MKAITVGVSVAALLAAALLLSNWIFAVGSAGAAVADVTGAGDAEQLVKNLQTLRPDIPIERVSPTPIPNIYALELGGGTVFYGTADGRYLFAGDLYELQEDDLVNLAESGRAEKRKAIMASVPRKDMVIFSPKGAVKAGVSVFTDVDCGYCQKLHQEVPQLNDMGIEVRYLAYPRAGVGSRSYQKIVSAWCAKDANTALTKLKAREEIPDAECTNPVAEQLDLGRDIGIAGTPAIVLDDGRILPGYLPADELARVLGI